MCVHDSSEELCLAPLNEEDFSEDQDQLTVDEDGASPFICSFRPDRWGEGGEILLVENAVVRAVAPATEADVASTTLVDEAEEIIKRSTTVETSKGNEMHVLWKTIMPLHIISSSNYANSSRTLALTLTSEIKRKPTSKGGIHMQKNRDYVRSILDTELVSYTDASEDNFVDVVDNDHEVYTTQLLNEE